MQLPNRPHILSSIESPTKDTYDDESLLDTIENGNTTIPHVLISLALEEEQLLDVEQCRKWLQDFPILAKSVTVQGVYRSNSTLLILSVPVLIWDLLPNHPACTFIGYAHSVDLLRLPSRPVVNLNARAILSTCLGRIALATKKIRRYVGYADIFCFILCILIFIWRSVSIGSFQLPTVHVVDWVVVGFDVLSFTTIGFFLNGARPESFATGISATSGSQYGRSLLLDTSRRCDPLKGRPGENPLCVSQTIGVGRHPADPSRRYPN